MNARAIGFLSVSIKTCAGRRSLPRTNPSCRTPQRRPHEPHPAGLGLSRFDMKYSAGTLPHEAMLRAIELYATRVVPLVRERLERAGR